MKKGETDPEIYTRKRKVFKWGLRRKKEKWAEHQLGEIMKDKSERKFWELIKSSRTKKE